MKRLTNIFHKIISIDNLLEAHRNARKDKSFYSEVQKVDKDPVFYCNQIQEMLINKTYKVSEYEIFEKQCDHKVRKIYKLPYFPDRIIQWALMLQIQERIDTHLIEQTYSAIKGRGIHKALLHINKALKNKEDTKYCLKIDVKKYYPNINQEILSKKMRKIIKCKDTLALLDQYITSLPANEGIPIGSYLSQYFGNYYLSELDHYCKEILKCKYYYRYMDDIVILDSSKERLWFIFKELEEKLKEEKLKIKENYKVFPLDSGLDFVGYRFFRNRIVARKSIYKKMKKRLNFLIKVKRTKNQECSYQSYKGWLKWTTCENLKRRYE